MALDRMTGVSGVLGPLILALILHGRAAAQDELPSDAWRTWKAEAQATLTTSSQQLGARLAEAPTLHAMEEQEDREFLAELNLLSAALDGDTSADLSKLKLLDKASLAILAVMLIDKLACKPRLSVESPLWIDARVTFGVWSGPQCTFGLRLKIVCEKGKWTESVKFFPGYLVPGQVTVVKNGCIKDDALAPYELMDKEAIVASLVELLAGYSA